MTKTADQVLTDVLFYAMEVGDTVLWEILTQGVEAKPLKANRIKTKGPLKKAISNKPKGKKNVLPIHKTK